MDITRPETEESCHLGHGDDPGGQYVEKKQMLYGINHMWNQKKKPNSQKQKAEQWSPGAGGVERGGAGQGAQTQVVR